jgi:hypothetical protein
LKLLSCSLHSGIISVLPFFQEFRLIWRTPIAV